MHALKITLLLGGLLVFVAVFWYLITLAFRNLPVNIKERQLRAYELSDREEDQEKARELRAELEALKRK